MSNGSEGEAQKEKAGVQDGETATIQLRCGEDRKAASRTLFSRVSVGLRREYLRETPQNTECNNV